MPVYRCPRLYGKSHPTEFGVIVRKIMPNPSYLDWVIRNTRTQWWHDSAQATELALGLERGAIGVTTNPYLANLALVKDRTLWASDIDRVIARNLPPESKAE